MDLADALIFAILAVADLGVLMRLHYRRQRRRRVERMMRSLKAAVRREIGPEKRQQAPISLPQVLDFA